MRMFVSFDLPTKTKYDQQVYRLFRRQLLDEGFIMMQYSTYVRFCRNDSEYSKYVRRIKQFAPKIEGDIRIYGLTERQYQNMQHICGRFKSDELLLGSLPLIVIE